MQLAVAAAPLLSVHFSCIAMAPRPPAAAGDEADFCFMPPFSSMLHEASWVRQAQRMILRVAGNLVHPEDLRFLVRAFCGYSHDALQSFLMQGGGRGGGLLSLSVLVQIPDATPAAGPYNPPPRPHLSDAVAGPYDHLVRAYLPANSTIQLDGGVLVLSPEEEGWGGEDAVADVGNRPASASAVRRLKSVVFGERNGGCRETSCAICIDDFEATSVLSVMPCGHGFHSACLDEWLKRSNLCPLCRFSLPAAN